MAVSRFRPTDPVVGAGGGGRGTSGRGGTTSPTAPRPWRVPPTRPAGRLTDRSVSAPHLYGSGRLGVNYGRLYDLGKFVPPGRMQRLGELVRRMEQALGSGHMAAAGRLARMIKKLMDELEDRYRGNPGLDDPFGGGAPWATTPARPPAGYILFQDCLRPEYPSYSFTDVITNCAAVSAGPPPSSFTPGQTAHEWGGPLWEHLPFPWTLRAKWVPGPDYDGVATPTPPRTFPLGETWPLSEEEPTVQVKPRLEPAPRRRVDIDGRDMVLPYRREAVAHVFPRVAPKPDASGQTARVPPARVWHYELPDRARKSRSVPAGFMAALKLFHAATELGDFVDALYDALGIFKCEGARGIAEKMLCVAQNWDRYFTDPAIMAAAMRNLVLNEIEDRIMGRLYGAGWQTGVRPFRDQYSSGVYVDAATGYSSGGQF